MAYQYVLYEAKDGIARITLNRPEKLNALSRDLQHDLVAAAKEAEADPSVHVVILRGAGRAFSAGYDITPSQRATNRPLTIREDISNMQGTMERWSTLLNLRKPIIAQVHGYCLAGGTDLALHCDMVIAAEDAQIGFPAVRSMGSPPTHMWTYMVGPQWAKWFLTTGNSVDGKTAERIGLVLKAVPADRLETEVDALASQLANVDCDLLAANKGIVNKALELMGRTMLENLAAENDAVAHMADAVKAFHETAAKAGLKAALEQRDSPFGDNRGRKSP